MKDIAVIPSLDTTPFLYQYIRIRNGYGFIESQIEEKAETTF